MPSNYPVGVKFLSKVINRNIHGNYFGDLYHEVFIRNASVNVAPDLDLGNIVGYFGSLENASFNLTNDDGVVFANENLTLSIVNNTFVRSFKCSSDSKGLVSFSLNNVPVGSYNFIVDYNNKTFNSTLTVSKAPVDLICPDYKTYYNSSKKYNVKVLNSKTNGVLKGIKVNLKVYTGKSYKTLTATTNNKGIASFDLSRNAVGIHKIILSVNKNVVSAKKDSTISISKANTIVKLSKTSFKYKKTDKLKIILKNKNTKKTISNISVKVKVYTGKKYKTYNLKTDKNGMVKISTKNLKKGSHKIVISSNSKNYIINKKSSIKIK